MSYASLVLADNPFAYWRLNETTGTIAEDEVGNYDGTYYHNPTLGVPGPIDLAAEFIFDLDHDLYSSVLLGELGTLGSSLASGISIECWIKPTYADYNLVFFAVNGTWSTITIQNNTALETPGTVCDVIWSISDADGNNVYGTNVTLDGEGNAILKNLYDGNWHHIVLTWDGTSDTTLFYLDGVLDKESHEYASVIPNNFVDYTDVQIAPVAIGESSVGYTGDIAEFAIYNHSLSLENIAAHFENEPSTSTPPTPVYDTCTIGLRCSVPTMHIACMKYINNAWVAAITVCDQEL